MKLYIDESGNTGSTLFSNSKFNFAEQPYYALAGILLNDSTKNSLENLVFSKRAEYKIDGDELKAKSLYEKKYDLINDIVNYIVDTKIPFFVELMDKKFFINIHIVNFFIDPIYSRPVTDKTVLHKKIIASCLSEYLNDDVYENFTKTTIGYTNETLENFYIFLIEHFNSNNQTQLAGLIKMTRDDYFEYKTKNKENALKRFLPLPDTNSNGRLIHCLPNYSALTNMIGRANLFCIENGNLNFDVVHDEQKQFDVIFEQAVETMKTVNTDSIVKNLEKKGVFNIDSSLNLSFVNSKDSIPIQIADIISGIVMRFWSDFKNNKHEQVIKWLPLIKKCTAQKIGINYVVPDQEHAKLMEIMRCF